VVDEPDAVVRAVEQVAGAAHRRSIDRKDDGAAVARTHGPRRLPIARQVDVMACHLAQPFAGDRLSRAMSRSYNQLCRLAEGALTF
jgi:hypothetical protein